jgi:hypothetical protein
MIMPRRSGLSAIMSDSASTELHMAGTQPFLLLSVSSSESSLGQTRVDVGTFATLQPGATAGVEVDTASIT